jgi:5-hydroxyisourate hydrolase
MTDKSRLTCHVLDLTRGLPAAGMALRLSRLDGPSAGVVLATATDADGRTARPLLHGPGLAPGRYELAFGVGDYFADADRTGDGAGGPAPIPYLDVVPVHFGVAVGVSHVHVALLVTPWSYTTYRGS